MPKDRIEYYGPNDYAYGHNMHKIETLQIPNYDSICINDAIEFGEIKKYFNDGIKSLDWIEQDLQKYIEKSNELYKLTMRFFNSLNDSNVVNEYNAVETGYKKQFWELFDATKLYNKISQGIFDELIKSKYCSPFDYLCFKNIAKNYGQVITDNLMTNGYGADVIIHYSEQNFSNVEKLYLPTEFCGEKITQCIKDYINSDFPNSNNLERIMLMQESNELPISDGLRLLAKRKREAENDKLFGNSVGFEYGFELSFAEEQDDLCIVSNDNNIYKYKYSKKHLDEMIGNPDILNNFIYLFEFVDKQMCCSFVKHKNGGSLFEALFNLHTSRDYPVDITFNLLNKLANAQLDMYYEFLKRKGIMLEQVIEWFFTHYLQEEFNVPEIKLSMPREALTFYEKCCSIIPTMDSIIKQYVSFVENGEIDFELIGMSTKPIKMENIPSFIKGKYVSSNTTDYNKISHLMFSDKSLLHYIERIEKLGKHYECFADLLLKENIALDEIENCNKKELEYLLKMGIIYVDNEFVRIKDKIKVGILKAIYKNDVINRYNYPDKYQATIDEMIESKLIEEYSSLLSVPEINYFNYILNRSEYRNGLEIRNRYIHGNQQVLTDEKLDRYNYMIILKVLLILIIKINDDLCLRDKNIQ